MAIMMSALLNSSVLTAKTAFASRPATRVSASRSLQIRASVVGDGGRRADTFLSGRVLDLCLCELNYAPVGMPPILC